jgi:hypothetical protein
VLALLVADGHGLLATLAADTLFGRTWDGWRDAYVLSVQFEIDLDPKTFPARPAEEQGTSW